MAGNESCDPCKENQPQLANYCETPPCTWVKWDRFGILGVSQIVVKKTSTWRQCPQMLASKARKKAPKREKCAKSTLFYPSFGHFWAPKPLSNWGKKRENAKSTLFCPPTDGGPPFPWWTFRIFFIFSAWGRGRGNQRRWQFAQKPF